MLILLEGPEGAGKTTMARRLVAHMEPAIHRVVYLREPGTTPGEKTVQEGIREVLLNPMYKAMSALTEFFLFQAARAQFVEHCLRPYLVTKYDVVLDRYSLSTMAYQIAGRGLPVAPCFSAIELATGGLIPDITFLLMCSYENGRARQAALGKKPDRLEAEGEEFHRKVIQGYRDFAQLLPGWNIHTIETDGLPPDDVFNRMLDIIRAENGIIG